uniref:Uncharacterized protein n=1 Tax=Ixodes ricinus TaxID=34613 RepID=A0A6B0TYL8_IXORI
MQAPDCMRVKASLILSMGSLWVMNSSSLIVPFRYSSTSWGTWSTLFQPPKAQPRHTRPVTSWKGRVEISWPVPATPRITDSPQPL